MVVKTDIWQFQAQLSQRLRAWSELSIAGGMILAMLGQRAWRGFGLQTVAWGAIDALIAGLAARSARSKAGEPNAHTPERQGRERLNLRRILWVNCGLDVGYVAGGALLALTRGRHDRFAAGTAWGISLQGAFLFFFDLVHALLCR